MPDETPEVERLRSWCAMLEEANAAWQSENAKLRELCADMWGWLTARTVSGAALHDISGRMHELGIEVGE